MQPPEPDNGWRDDPRLRRPLPPAQGKSSSSPLSIILAFGATAFICVGLFFLTSGFFGVVMVIGGLAFGFAALHYLVWGWWLGKVIQHDVEAEEQEEDERRSRPTSDN
jgi:hypothetical protein